MNIPYCSRLPGCGCCAEAEMAYNMYMDALAAWDAGQLGWNTSEWDKQLIPDILIGIIRKRWSSRHEHSFFAVRSFTTDKKDEEMEILQEYKATGKCQRILPTK